jgi:hypothetical protein
MEVPMRRLALILTAALLALTQVPDAARAAGPVVITVTGEIETTNRGPYDPFADVLFGVLEEPFERAYGFTLDDLAALPQQTVELSYPNWPAPVTVSGPTLAAVLDRVGAKGDRVLVQAVDGYAPGFKIAEVKAGSFVLATSLAGTPLPLGGRGPVWLVFPAGSYAGQTAEDDSGLAWAVFHLKIVSGE